MTNAATYNERPVEFKALQWDSFESRETMMAWLREMHMRDVRYVELRDRHHIEFKSPHKKFQVDHNEPIRMYIGEYVIINQQDGSFEVLGEQEMKTKYHQRLAESAMDTFVRGLENLDIDLLRTAVGLPVREQEIYRPKSFLNKDLDSEFRKHLGLPAKDYNEVGVNLSDEFAKAASEPDSTVPAEKENPAQQIMLQGLCLIEGKLYGIRESDGSLDEITFNNSVFSGEPKITHVEVHYNKYDPADLPVGDLESEADCCGRDSEPEETVDETVNLESDELAESRDFQRDVAKLLNKWSAETVSGTPDFILAEFFETVLGAWNDATAKRAKWRGESLQLPALQKMQGKSVFYNEDNLHKVREAIDTLTERQIYTNVRKVKRNVTTDMVIHALLDAGVFGTNDEPEPAGEDYVIEYTKYNDSTVDKGAALLQQAFPMMKTEVIFQAMTHLAENGILFREQL